MKYGIILLMLLMVACKKKDERSCWKGHGTDSSLEIQLDSVDSWVLNKGIKYRIFQDSTRKLIVKGGENTIKLLTTTYTGNQLEISNENKCNFLRNADQFIEVEIHYPFYREFYIEPSDSVIFENTIQSNWLVIEMREAGGSMKIDVDAGFFRTVVSHGTADYVLSGHANQAEVKVQNNGYADASEFTAESYFAYQNSNVEMYLNLDGANALVVIDGTGAVFYKGTPAQLTTDGVGTGKICTILAPLTLPNSQLANG